MSQANANAAEVGSAVTIKPEAKPSDVLLEHANLIFSAQVEMANKIGRAHV